MASVAEEIAALRGTRPTTFRDLLVHPSFSRLWRAMLVSSLGDWVGFVAVATLVSAKGGKALGGVAGAGGILGPPPPPGLFRPPARGLGGSLARRPLLGGAHGPP